MSTAVIPIRDDGRLDWVIAVESWQEVGRFVIRCGGGADRTC